MPKEITIDLLDSPVAAASQPDGKISSSEERGAFSGRGSLAFRSLESDDRSGT